MTNDKKQAPSEQDSHPAKVGEDKENRPEGKTVPSWVKDVSGGGRDMYL